jgi:hypothetical protein
LVAPAALAAATRSGVRMPASDRRHLLAAASAMRARVIPSPTPTCSKVCGVSPSSPKRSASTQRKRGFRCDSAVASSFARSLVDVLSSGVSELTLLDQIAVHALAVADRCLEADGVLNELEQFADALLLEARCGVR